MVVLLFRKRCDLLTECTVPIYQKAALTLEEAAQYSNIGVNKLREITNDAKCTFVFYVGSKRLIKRKLFDQYIERISFI